MQICLLNQSVLTDEPMKKQKAKTRIMLHQSMDIKPDEPTEEQVNLVRDSADAVLTSVDM